MSPTSPKSAFPAGFTWGAATSSFQIEGATDVGGRGESIWDRFCAEPGRIADASDGKVACDHYNRWPGDVEILQSLGVGAYRFSVAWPRVVPDGRGAVNKAGLDFYDRLVDGLLAKGIDPHATLYHWDLPQKLQDAGGWTNRDTAYAFAEYADAVARRLGDRVKHWMTHNEPWCVTMLGHLTGEHAPGHKSWPEALAAAHHVLLSHGLAVPVIRAASPGSKVGIVLNFAPAVPASDSAADRDALRSFDGWFHRWFMDPLYFGRYPADMQAEYLEKGHVTSFDFVSPGDLATMAAPTDFLGVNYYSRAIIRSKDVPESENAPRLIPEPLPAVCTDMGWEVYPDGLRQLLLRLHRDYGPKSIVVTENGAAYANGPDATGRINDEPRRAYLEGHLAACHAAIAEGVPLHGYFVWSLLDNFEWAYGYEKRFGVVWVDFKTQQRTLKDSALWYRDVVRANALPPRKP